MKEYIEREAAINAMCRLCSDTTRDKCRIADICNYVCRLEAIPAADVRPVVLCRDCDCGKDCYIKTILTEDCEVEEPFCAAGKPGCGADMREEG